MSVPDAEWWRRRAVAWKRLAKKQRHNAAWADRPILMARMPMRCSRDEAEEMTEALSKLSDRVIVLHEGDGQLEYVMPFSSVTKRLLVQLAAWVGAEKARQAKYPEINHSTVLLDVWNDLPERMRQYGQDQLCKLQE